jgi:hypothetical protein
VEWGETGYKPGVEWGDMGREWGGMGWNARGVGGAEEIASIAGIAKKWRLGNQSHRGDAEARRKQGQGLTTDRHG